MISIRRLLAAGWFWLLLLLLLMSASAEAQGDSVLADKDKPSPIPSDEERISLLLAQRRALIAEIQRLNFIIQAYESAAKVKAENEGLEAATKRLGCALDSEFRCLPKPPLALPSPLPPTPSIAPPDRPKP